MAPQQAPQPSRFAELTGRARAMLSDETTKKAEKMLADLTAQGNAQLGEGPAVRRVSGGTRENGYNTELTDGAEQAYQGYQRRMFPGQMNDDYDLRGAYAAGTERDAESMHFPDTFKKPNHDTFSDESQYAEGNEDIAGSWKGDKYQPKGPPAWLRQEQERPQARGAKDPMGDALADGLAPFQYEYKPEFGGNEGQAPGEKNTGIMAQNAEKNPITGVIVERGEDGLRRINMKKSVSLGLAAAGHNAQRIREMGAEIDKLKGAR